jgi:hypothetical protein
VTSNGSESPQYAGAAPGLIDGIMQINFMVSLQSSVSPSQSYFVLLGASGLIWVTQ